MTWREDFRRVDVGGRQMIGASFRGVGFLVESGERAGGRRAVSHEFPFVDDPVVEDLGRKARTFRVEGHVIGDDYLVQRDALLAALEDTAGPGELVHPHHGVRYAICTSLSVREARTEGGMAVFAIEFAESPTQRVPTVVVSQGSIQPAVVAARSVLRAELADRYVVSLPAFALASAERAIAAAADAVGRRLGGIEATTQELATLAGRLKLIAARASALARQPVEVWDSFLEALGALAVTIATTPGAVVDELLEAYGFDPGPAPPLLTATRTTEAANQSALTAAIRQVLLLEAARLAPLVTYESIEDATAARDRIAALLEEQAETAGDEAYAALTDVRSSLLRDLPGTTVFARVVPLEQRVAVPSIVLAHRLYGSVAREQDIVARNQVKHPALVAGSLKVLSAV